MSRALTLLEQGVSVIRVAAELQVTRMTVYRLKKAGDALPPGTTPRRKKGSGRPRKTSARTNFILKKEVKADPGITALELKEKHPKLLQDVAVRTVQHRLQKDLKIPSRRAAKKPLLSDKRRKKRLQFCKKYRHWNQMKNILEKERPCSIPDLKEALKKHWNLDLDGPRVFLQPRHFDAQEDRDGDQE